MPKQMSEAQAVNLVRNALVVAGEEMGAEGDHWPVIKSTVFQIMKDHENLQVRRNVSLELMKYYADMIARLEKEAATYPDELRQPVELHIKRIKEIYEARYSPMDMTMFVVCDADTPIHIKRAENIISTLGDDHGA